MRLDQLRYFVQIVEKRSFNKAAKALFITQPALTNAISALESELNVQLLVRSNHGAEPTQYGKIVYDDCRGLLAALDEKISTWQSFGEERSIDVQIVGIPTACNYLSDEIVPRIKGQMSGINIVLRECEQVGFLDFLQKNSQTIGLTAIETMQAEQEIKKYERAGFHAEKLINDEYCIFLSSQHELASKPTLTATDCKSLSFATYASQYNDSESLIDRFRHVLTIKEVFYLNGRESIMQMIAQNKAAGLFLHQMTMNNWYVQQKLICRRLVQGVKLFPSQHYLFWNMALKQDSAEKKVADFIKNNYIQV